MKKQKMFLKMITASLIRRRSRMLVALLAIAVGATILSGLVTIYYDVPRQMGEQFRNYGANMILTPAEGGALSQADIDEGLTCIPEDNVVGCAPYRYESVTIVERPYMAAGTNLSEVQKTSPYWNVDGAWPSVSGEILVGKNVASTFALKPGDSMTLSYDILSPDGKPATADETRDVPTRDMTFRVTGILDTGGKEEDYVFLSVEDMTALTGEEGGFDVAELSVSASSEELQGYADAINSKSIPLSSRLVKRVTQSENTVLSKLQALVFLVTAIVLLLTMICVATTMMAVVTERRKEVGLRKALGASDASIIMEFMGEGLLLGGVGGLLGSFLGFAFAQAVSVNVFNSSITFHFLLVPLTMLVSILVTGLSCILPVRSAIDIDPALVLKGE